MPQTSLDLGSDNFCVEAWVYTTSTANQAIIGSYRYADGVGSWNLNVNYNSQKLRFFIRHSSGTVIDGQFESGTFPTNQWVHVAVTRDGANLRAFINGTQAGSTNTSLGSSSIDNAVTTYRIGASNDNGIHWNGNIADARVVKGSSVYTADFTPTTVPLTAITNTIFLAQSTDAGIIDKSQTTKKVQLFADTKSSTAQYKFLSSSIYFDGTGDYLKTSSSGNFLAEGPWTQEMWLRLAGTGAGQQIGPAFGGGTAGWNSSTGHQWLLYTHSSAGFVAQYYGTNNSHNTITIASSAPFTANTWHHWAISWDGTTLRFFMDGTSVHTTTSFIPNTMTATHTELGRMPDNSYYSQAYYSDVRITKGLARYTANFTAPTAALQG